ncbi:hypothetical protein Taro_040461 [Colocasia esculenta]|uniref:Uncharacterized protein n=1 Tax=Colocasia esculenta TaxID=4460 RepID=A0A843WBY4_COLES|nr:hypothetical protein [Colocasia esculenta]
MDQTRGRASECAHVARVERLCDDGTPNRRPWLSPTLWVRGQLVCVVELRYSVLALLGCCE